MLDQFGRWLPDFPGQQPYQDPAYLRAMGQHQPQQNNAAPPRLVEAVPADNEKTAQEFPVAAGETKIIIARDDSFIAVKSVTVTGQVSFDMYDKRPPAPPTPILNPTEYVRKDEIEALVAAAMRAENAQKKKKEAE